MKRAARAGINARDDEARLIAAARQGEGDAFNTLYRQQIGNVRAMARCMLRTPEVEDVCQEVFLRVFRGLPDFAEACSFRTWTSRITLHECLRTLRRAAQASNGDKHLVALDAAMGVTQGDTDRMGLRLDLERMLAVLKPAQRRVLEMAYVEDMHAAEIAAELGSTVAQVKSTLHRAKERVRRNNMEGTDLR